MSHGVLIGPNVEDTTILDRDEYKIALKAVQFMRAADDGANSIARALKTCKSGDKAEEPYEGMTTLTSFLHRLMVALAEDQADEAEGMFVEFAEPPILLLTHAYDNGAERVQCVKALLDIFARKGWLADFLLTYMPFWAKRQITPMELMWRLSEQAADFESDLETAKDMLREWPQLLRESVPVQEKEAKQS
jgi:hypothetical protein